MCQALRVFALVLFCLWPLGLWAEPGAGIKAEDLVDDLSRPVEAGPALPQTRLEPRIFTAESLGAGFVRSDLLPSNNGYQLYWQRADWASWWNWGLGLMRQASRSASLVQDLEPSGPEQLLLQTGGWGFVEMAPFHPQDRWAGLDLTFVPYLSLGLGMLDVAQELQVVGQSTSNAGLLYPSLSKRRSQALYWAGLAEVGFALKMGAMWGFRLSAQALAPLQYRRKEDLTTGVTFAELYPQSTDPALQQAFTDQRVGERLEEHWQALQAPRLYGLSFFAHF